MKNNSWKLPLIIALIIAAVILMIVFWMNGFKNKAISYEEQITSAQSEIKIQEKRRSDLIPNLVDCVKAYDRHEYETLMAIVNARGQNSDEMAKEIKTQIKAVAEAYPELQSSKQYQELMNELATTENKIAITRTNYNMWVTKYNSYIKHFPNNQVLSIIGYESTVYNKLDFDVSEKAPTNLFD